MAIKVRKPKMVDFIDRIVGYSPPPQSLRQNSSTDDNPQDNDGSKHTTRKHAILAKDDPFKSQIDELIEFANKNIDLLFRDQFNEGFARIIVKGHYEITPLKSSRFKRFLSKIYYESTNYHTANPSTISCVLDILQAKAEFGEAQHHLSLRVAEYGGDLYYDLTNDVHQSVRISKDGYWEIIDATPIPLFRRHNQTPQDYPLLVDDNQPSEEEREDPLDIFISKYTNIRDKDTRLVVKVAIVSWFVPNIPHPMFIVHGGKGSAKSTFMTMVKHIVDPAKPSLFTIHDDKAEFIQQLAHNYLAPYDNLKHNPKWLSDEACKAITGIGQSKRALYTDDEDKIFEYKHCLMFNGINVAFSEPDIIDRSIIIELPEMKEDDRRTEGEILNEFFGLRPTILKYNFDVLAKAIAIKKDLKIKKLPRMADFALWGTAISQAMGYRYNEFLKAYYNNIRYQNTEVIDSNPVAFAIKKFVESVDSANANYGGGGSNDCTFDINSNIKTYFKGTPAELLKRLDQIAKDNKIDERSPEWPKDQRWLVKRIKQVISNLQQNMGISIIIDRDSNNTSTIKMEKVIPHDEKLSPHLEKISPENNKVSPVGQGNISTESAKSGDSGDTGDISHIPIDNSKCYADSIISANPMVGYRKPFYYCKQHPNVQNIHPEEIKHHAEHSKEHHGQPST